MPPLVVLALSAADFGDSPALLVAVTWKLYEVEAASPVTVAEVPLTEATSAPSR